ncbi:MAG: hypothetical protein ACXVDD_08230, partial [Polyangia bacterium]
MVPAFAWFVVLAVTGGAVPAAAPATPQNVAPAPAPAAAVAPPPAPPPPPDVAAGERSDGRRDPPSARRWRLLPEVLLFPLRALFWGLRWPIGAALRLEDRHHPFRRIV